MNQSNVDKPSRAAFTLLEMLLTLAMCVVLMTLVSGAISFYVREMASAEQVYRNSQVASAVLQMIEDDLRMTLTTRPVDTAPLGDVLSSASSPLLGLSLSYDTAGDSEDDSLPEDSGLSGTEGDSSSEEPADGESFDASLGGSVLQSPGLIGSSNQLQIDISRLPSLEESVLDPALAISNGKLLDRPSDIKTVSYFVQPPGAGASMDPLEELATASGMGNAASSAALASGGLVRRELDRAITSHASSTGGLSRLTSAGEVISTEVTAIQFEYYENGNWMTYYSTDTVGFLPPAIRVTIQIGGDSAFGSENLAETQAVNTYTHVIYLPMSHPEDAEETTEETDTMASEGTGI